MLGWLGDGIFHFLWFGMPGFEFIPFTLLRIVAVRAIVLAVIAIVGGIYAIKRKRWGLAIAGSTCAVLLCWFFGIPAIILIAMPKKSFA